MRGGERRAFFVRCKMFGGVLALMPQSDVGAGVPRNLKMHNAQSRQLRRS